VIQAQAAVAQAESQRQQAEANQTALEQNVSGACAANVNPLTGQRTAPNGSACGDAQTAANQAVEAANEGLASAFVGVDDPPALQNLLGIPDHFLPIGVVMIGHGAQDVPSPSLQRGRRRLEDVLHREHW